MPTRTLERTGTSGQYPAMSQAQMLKKVEELNVIFGGRDLRRK